MNKLKKQTPIKNLYIIKTTQVYNFAQPMLNCLKLPRLQLFTNQLKFLFNDISKRGVLVG